MHFNFYFLKHLSRALEKKLLNKQLLECFSQSKDELILVFGENRKAEFYIRAIFNNQTNLISFPYQFQRAKKNSVDLFSVLIGRSVVGVRQFNNERSFSFKFEDEHDLLFKLHGQRANLILFQKGQLISMFKNNFQNDKHLDLDNLDKNIDQSEEALIASNYNLKEKFPTFDKKIKTYLENLNFEKLDLSDKKNEFSKLLAKLESRHFYIEKDPNERPFLNLIPKQSNVIFETDDPIEACNTLSRQFFQVYQFSLEKERQIKQVTKEIISCSSYIKKAENKLNLLENGIKHDEVANILMANLHVDRPKENSIELFDFYRNQDIQISLKKGMSLQSNAQIHYRKAKNQGIEIKKIKENIDSKKRILQNLQELQKRLNDAEDIKSLKKISSGNSGQSTKLESAGPKPFTSYEVDNYQVLIGKNAKANDELLRNYSSKEDLWMHARDVSGSHVIVKNPRENISKDTIEKIAGIAAWYSKGKNDSLCPVVYTKRKYIHKPKGAAPGEVKVQKEQVILVNPCQNPQ